MNYESLAGSIPSQFLDGGEFNQSPVAVENLPPPRPAFIPGREAMVEAARDISKAMDEVLVEMRQLVRMFHKQYPIRVGFKGGYTLVLIKCGKKGCPICPHSIRWAQYDCVRKKMDEALIDLPEHLRQRPPIQRGRGWHNDDMGINSLLLPSNPVAAPFPAEKSGRRTKIFWHAKRYTALPSRFHQLKKDADWYADFVWYNNEIKRLNSIRKLLGEYRRRILRMRKSLSGALQAAEHQREIQKNVLDHAQLD